ncbi:V-type ATP synthase subunit D [Clostridiaceae bacterium JG1575]|nr:V-type ATP synthase subunit D [Clostridiaceae bacterium JG1575]
MAKLNVSPTRMELTKLKARLKTATRGHKLLKDKQDELMRKFIEMIRKNQKLRVAVEEELEAAFKDFLLARAMMSDQTLEAALMMPTESISVDIQKRNIMSVNVPEMEFIRNAEGGSIHPYGYADTSADLDDAIERLHDIMPRLLELAQVEKACMLMADEIERTRRRVNALEYMTIPDLEETIRFIRMKLDENERSSITRLMKVKSMMEAKDQSAAAAR